MRFTPSQNDFSTDLYVNWSPPLNISSPYMLQFALVWGQYERLQLVVQFFPRSAFDVINYWPSLPYFWSELTASRTELWWNNKTAPMCPIIFNKQYNRYFHLYSTINCQSSIGSHLNIADIIMSINSSEVNLDDHAITSVEKERGQLSDWLWNGQELVPSGQGPRIMLSTALFAETEVDGRYL